MKLFLIIFLINVSLDTVKKKYHKAIRTQNPLEAIEYYREVINDAPKSAYADSSLFRIGMFYYLIGDYEQVINTLEVIYNKGEKSSLYRKACYWTMLSYHNREDTTKALEFAKIIENLKKPEKIKLENLAKNQKTERDSEPAIYIVQLGAYRDKDWAELFLLRLKQHGIESYTIGIGDYIKICSGKFPTKKEAEAHLEELRNKGFDGFIVQFEP